MPCSHVTVNGVAAIICGPKRIETCVQRGEMASLLCDYPVVRGVTCDVPLCARCAVEIGPNLHLCPGHAERYRGGIQQSLNR
ncbi:MAG: hypothetical protein HYU77_13710 [Betaproteobacteria bacterium]|nr:hypothetical protein [Betaproteobacteria bacterium]